jgi:hypothetical protein
LINTRIEPGFAIDFKNEIKFRVEAFGNSIIRNIIFINATSISSFLMKRTVVVVHESWGTGWPQEAENKFGNTLTELLIFS